MCALRRFYWGLVGTRVGIALGETHPLYGHPENGAGRWSREFADVLGCDFFGDSSGAVRPETRTSETDVAMNGAWLSKVANVSAAVREKGCRESELGSTTRGVAGPGPG